MFCRRQRCVWCEKKISWKNLIEALRNKSKEFLWTSKKFHQLASSFDLSRIRRKILVLSAFVSFVSRYDGSKKGFSFFFQFHLNARKKSPFHQTTQHWWWAKGCVGGSRTKKMVVKHDEGGRYCSNSEPTTSSTIQFIFYAFQYTMKLPSLASIRKKMRCKSFFLPEISSFSIHSTY